MDIEQQLAQCLHNYATDGLYVLDGIPPKKLCNAIQHFPIDAREKVIALIDSTVMGSCKTGMAFGLRGVYWKNDWTTQTQRNFMTWEELSGCKHLIGPKFFDVIIGPGNVCNLSGSSVKPPLASNLLRQLIDVYIDFASYSQSGAQPEAIIATNSSPTQIVLQPESIIHGGILEKSDRYSEGITKAFAIMICADGEIEESEVDLATQFIEADDEIVDKALALESLITLIEGLHAEHVKSKAIFKLKSSKMIAQVHDEIVGGARQHALVMLGELLDVTNGANNPVNRDVYDRLVVALTD